MITDHRSSRALCANRHDSSSSSSSPLILSNVRREERSFLSVGETFAPGINMSDTRSTKLTTVLSYEKEREGERERERILRILFRVADRANGAIRPDNVALVFPWLRNFHNHKRIASLPIPGSCFLSAIFRQRQTKVSSFVSRHAPASSFARQPEFIKALVSVFLLVHISSFGQFSF